VACAELLVGLCSSALELSVGVGWVVVVLPRPLALLSISAFCLWDCCKSKHVALALYSIVAVLTVIYSKKSSPITGLEWPRVFFGS